MNENELKLLKFLEEFDFDDFWKKFNDEYYVWNEKLNKIPYTIEILNRIYNLIDIDDCIWPLGFGFDEREKNKIFSEIMDEFNVSKEILDNSFEYLLTDKFSIDNLSEIIDLRNSNCFPYDYKINGL